MLITERTALRAVGPVDDVELMRRVQQDDAEAFAALYDRFATRAFRAAFSIAHDKTRAEDIVQEAFLSIWRSRAQYKPVLGGVPGWIMGAVKHRAIDVVRHQSRHDKQRASLEGAERVACNRSSAEDTAIERDEAAGLRLLLARLSAEQREVIGLAYFGEMTTHEIACQLHLPLGTVKGRLRLGLGNLRSATAPAAGLSAA